MSVIDMNSGRMINYSTRVAKSIERKMIRDALLRLYSFSHTSKYQYVGFGSKYFTDFILFHKHLHINSMISIESDTGGRLKYEFNKPFNCIQMCFGTSNDVLPTLNFDKKTILWLDYDGLLNDSCMSDIYYFVTKATSGSVLVISYNSRPYKNSELAKEMPEVSAKARQKEKFLSQLDKKYIPFDESFDGLGRWDAHSKLLRKTVLICIDIALNMINSSLPEQDKVSFSQIFNFNYKDGVEMSTLGFVFYKQAEKHNLTACKFDEIEYCRADDDFFEIKVPNFTLKEVKSIIEKMPMESKDFKKTGLDKSVFDEGDVIAFSKIYKYSPHYIDSDII